MSYIDDIHSLSDLIDYGVGKIGYEDDTYLYIWAADPDRTFYDSSLYKYNKKEKKIEWVSTMTAVAKELNAANKVEMNAEYLKKYL